MEITNKNMTAEEYFNKWNLEHYYEPNNHNDLIRIMNDYARKKCQDLLLLVTEKAEIGMKKKSNYGTHRKWQRVKEDEVDLFDYQVQYFVDKDSILNAVDLDSFCS